MRRPRRPPPKPTAGWSKTNNTYRTPSVARLSYKHRSTAPTPKPPRIANTPAQLQAELTAAQETAARESAETEGRLQAAVGASEAKAKEHQQRATELERQLARAQEETAQADAAQIELATEIASLHAALDTATGEAGIHEQRAAQLESELATALEAATRDIAETELRLQAWVDAAQADAKKHQQRAAELEGELATALENAGRVGAETEARLQASIESEAGEQLAILAAELEEAQTRADTLAEVVRAESGRRETLQRELDVASQAKVEHEAHTAELRSEIDSLTAEREALTADRGSHAQVAGLVSELASATAARVGAEQALAALTGELQTAIGANERARAETWATTANYEQQAAARERAERRAEQLEGQLEQLVARAAELESRLSDAIARAERGDRLERELAEARHEIDLARARIQRTAEETETDRAQLEARIAVLCTRTRSCRRRACADATGCRAADGPSGQPQLREQPQPKSSVPVSGRHDGRVPAASPSPCRSPRQSPRSRNPWTRTTGSIERRTGGGGCRVSGRSRNCAHCRRR